VAATALPKRRNQRGHSINDIATYKKACNHKDEKPETTMFS
jgi:hypothetical protein